MLGSGMKEQQMGRVQVEDAEPVILKQMLQYLYTGKLEPDFSDYKELMILANKYQMEELVGYTSRKVLENLTEANALKLGMFGEMHNSTVLLNASAKFIHENPSVETLPDGWEQALKDSPRLMLAIIGAARREAGKVTEFARITPGGTGTWMVQPGQVDAIGFKVSTKARLAGVGMYGVKGTNKVALKIYQGNQLLSEEVKNYHSEGGSVYTNLPLKAAVKLEADTVYDITVERLTGQATVSRGEGGKTLVQVGKVDVRFSNSGRDNNSTKVNRGQIPAVYIVL